MSRLGSLSRGRWGALGRRFRDIGFTSRACAPFAQLGALTPSPRHAALAKWHLRRTREPSAYAMRMMTFCDPVTPAEARSVLGDAAPLEQLVDAGLLVATDEGVVSAFLLAEWPVVEGDAPVDERIAEALGPPGNLGMLHLRLPDSSIDEHCARYATIEHPLADADYERAAMRRREHFEQMRIRALVPMVSVLRRNDGQPGVHATGRATALSDEDLAKVEEALLAGQLEVVDS